MSPTLKILIIEDDLVLAENLKENLEEMGYKALGIASNLADAQSLLTVPPDLMIVDIQLEGSSLTGIDIVRELTLLIDCPVIYLTSYDGKSYREQAKKTNPAAYLLKPANKKQIDVAIDFAFSNHYRARIKPENSHSSFYPVQSAYFIKDGEKYIKLRAEDICVLQANGSYTIIHTPYKNYTLSGYLQKIVEQFNIPTLQKCHRSYYINTDFLHSISSDDITLFMGNELITLPLSTSYRDEFFSGINKIKS